MKVFCVGFNKTGTTSLHEHFVAAGLRSAHDATYQRRTRTMAREELRSYLDAHDAFSDGERAAIGRLRDLYPDAVFVLNTRGLQDWLESRVRHVFREGGVALDDPDPTGGSKPRPGLLAGGMAREYLRDPEGAISDWIDRREYFHRMVLDLARASPDRFLVLSVVEQDDWRRRLDEFLSLEGTTAMRGPIRANVASADPDAFDLPARLRQVAKVLDHKGFPRDSWSTQTYVGPPAV